MHFVLTNHFREREAEFGGAHRAAKRDHHFAAASEMRDVAFGGVHERRGVEVAIVMLDELRNGSAGNLRWFFLCHKIIDRRVAESRRKMKAEFLKFENCLCASAFLR
jgi:hypothetical protein